MKKSTAALSFALLLSATVAKAEDLEFLLVNETSSDLIEFNISSSSSNDWEGDLLEDGYLGSGYEVEVQIADGLDTCIYDIRGVFDDGSSSEEFGVDLCDLGEYAFSE